MLCPECGLAVARAEVSEGGVGLVRQGGGVGKRITLTFKKLVVGLEEPVNAEVYSAVFLPLLDVFSLHAVSQVLFVRAAALFRIPLKRLKLVTKGKVKPKTTSIL